MQREVRKFHSFLADSGTERAFSAQWIRYVAWTTGHPFQARLRYTGTGGFLVPRLLAAVAVAALGAERNTARAMSQENVEIVKRAITAINERDVAAYLAVCASDFELINPIAAIEGSNKGEQGVRAFFDGIREGATKFELEIERLEALDDDRVLAWLTLDMETKGGFPQSQPLTNLYELKDGKLLRVRVFFDREEAFEAAGLSE